VGIALPSSLILLTTIYNTVYLFHEEELPILCLITYIIAIALYNNAIQVGDWPVSAEPFFIINLKDFIKVVKVY
jgi:hypothetical protein